MASPDLTELRNEQDRRSAPVEACQPALTECALAGLGSKVSCGGLQETQGGSVEAHRRQRLQRCPLLLEPRLDRDATARVPHRL